MTAPVFGVSRREQVTRKGMCKGCDVVWVWEGETPLVRETDCPVCGRRLQKTTRRASLQFHAARVMDHGDHQEIEPLWGPAHLEP